jgi:outer membrane protein TolC
MRTATAVILLLTSMLPAQAGVSPAPVQRVVPNGVTDTGQSTPDAVSLTLPQALARALASSPRLERARGGVALARGQKRGARAEGMPSVDLKTSGVVQGPEKRAVRPTHQFEAKAEATVPLDTNGRIKAGKRSAIYAVRAAEARLEAEAQQLVLDVTEAYLDTLQAGQETVLVTELRKLDEERWRLARVRLAAGVAAPLEVSQTEADRAQAVQREIESQARLRQVKATLNSLLGRPAAAELQVADLSPVRAGSAEGILPTGMERPDLRALQAEVDRAKAEVDAARASRRPLAGLTGNLTEQTPSTIFGGFAWSLGVSLVQSLFDGGRSRARVEQARAEQTQAGASLAEAKRQVDAQVEQSRAALEAAERRLQAADERVTAAGDALRMARRRVEVGTAPALEATEAETVLTRAKTDALTARYDLRRAQVRLAYAVGVAYPDTVVGRVVGPG